MVTLVTVTSDSYYARMGLNKQQSRKRHCDTATTLGYSLAVFVCASIRARELPMKTAESIEAQEERKNARDNAKPCLRTVNQSRKTGSPATQVTQPESLRGNGRRVFVRILAVGPSMTWLRK